jgi:hypothetical protein
MPHPPPENPSTRTNKLQPDEVDIEVALVSRHRGRIPGIGDVAIRPVRTTGTGNAISRLGDRLNARMPRAAEWGASLENELVWLDPSMDPVWVRKITTHAIPTPVSPQQAWEMRGETSPRKDRMDERAARRAGRRSALGSGPVPRRDRRLHPRLVLGASQYLTSLAPRIGDAPRSSEGPQ